MARNSVLTISAEMVAAVLEVSVAPGHRVEVGDEVALLESMKMEIPVIADVAGVVLGVKVAAGDVVQEGDVLLDLSPLD